jgi:hypothetical protein
MTEDEESTTLDIPASSAKGMINPSLKPVRRFTSQFLPLICLFFPNTALN